MFYFLHNSYIDYFNLLEYINPIKIFFFIFHYFIFASCILFTLLQISLQKNVEKFNFKLLMPFFSIKKLVKIIQIMIILQVLNPFLYFFSITIFNNFFILTPEITLLKIIILILCNFILKSNFFYIFIQKLAINDFILFFGQLIFFSLYLLQINDFFILFLLFEIISLILYILFIYHKQFILSQTKRKTKISLTKYQRFLFYFIFKSRFFTLNIFATILYLLLNVFFSILFLIGIHFLLIFIHSTNFVNILFYLNNLVFFDTNQLIIISFLSFFFFFLFKFGIVPFHQQLPAIYQSTSILTVMFLAIPLKLIYLLIFLKIFFNFFSVFYATFKFFLIFFALFSMVIGTLGLFSQTQLRKFQSYITINNMSYLLLSLVSFTFFVIRSFLIYLIFYILINLLFFILLQTLINQTINQLIIFISQLKTLACYKNHQLIFIFSILIFSLIGIPPFFGFQGKYLIISNLSFCLNFNITLIIFVVIIITTILSAFCYLKIQKTLLFENQQLTNFILFPIPIFHANFFFFFLIFFFFFSFIFFFNDFFFFFLDSFIIKFLNIFDYNQETYFKLKITCYNCFFFSFKLNQEKINKMFNNFLFIQFGFFLTILMIIIFVTFYFSNNPENVINIINYLKPPSAFKFKYWQIILLFFFLQIVLFILFFQKLSQKTKLIFIIFSNVLLMGAEFFIQYNFTLLEKHIIMDNLLMILINILILLFYVCTLLVINYKKLRETTDISKLMKLCFFQSTKLVLSFTMLTQLILFSPFGFSQLKYNLSKISFGIAQKYSTQKWVIAQLEHMIGYLETVQTANIRFNTVEPRVLELLSDIPFSQHITFYTPLIHLLLMYILAFLIFFFIIVSLRNVQELIKKFQHIIPYLIFYFLLYHIFSVVIWRYLLLITIIYLKYFPKLSVTADPMLLEDISLMTHIKTNENIFYSIINEYFLLNISALSIIFSLLMVYFLHTPQILKLLPELKQHLQYPLFILFFIIMQYGICMPINNMIIDFMLEQQLSIFNHIKYPLDIPFDPNQLDPNNKIRPLYTKNDVYRPLLNFYRIYLDILIGPTKFEASPLFNDFYLKFQTISGEALKNFITSEVKVKLAYQIYGFTTLFYLLAMFKHLYIKFTKK